MKLIKMAAVIGAVSVLAGPALAVQPNAAARLAVKTAQSDAHVLTPVRWKFSWGRYYPLGPKDWSCRLCGPN